ncbi:MAG: regulator of protease activity HflC (stomatin/prohibitin superfamily) [Limisphaerales bacterium]|jgi:regulator of protease activity HflC (stomatin/prohibitin superfamily)
MNEFDQMRQNMRRRRPILIGLATLLILFIVISRAILILQPTERGVVFKKYAGGLDVDNVKGEGLSFVAPWNDVIIFEVEEQQIEEKMDVLSQDGLSITIDVSLRFRPKPDEIGYLYKAFRKNYIENFVRPELRSGVRRVIGQYTPEELYSTKRQEIESLIEEGTRETLNENHLEVKALLFRSIQLPLPIKNAIEEKLAADQEAQKYSYLILKEVKEAERIRVAAEGKAAANLILDASLTDNILKERGIDATEAIANSPNAKVIVIGGGEGGLPIILGNQ